MEDQTEFVRWWDETIGVRQHSHSEVNAAQRSPISREAAEDATQIKQQQVSKWRNRLKDPEKYRALLFGVAYNKAMAETSNTTATKWTGDPESYTPTKYIEDVDDGWDVIHLGHLWPYCLATRQQLKTKPAEVSNGGLDHAPSGVR